MNTRITKAQLQVKEVMTYAVLPIVILILLLSLISYLVYRRFGKKYQLFRLIDNYNFLVKINRPKEAELLLISIGYLVLDEKYSRVITKLKQNTVTNELFDKSILKIKDEYNILKDRIKICELKSK
jgi:hypothetical protein